MGNVWIFQKRILTLSLAGIKCSWLSGQLVRDQREEIKKIAKFTAEDMQRSFVSIGLHIYRHIIGRIVDKVDHFNNG